jgi:hypothetical protein
MAMVAVMPGSAPNTIPITTPMNDMTSWVIPKVNTSIASLLRAG